MIDVCAHESVSNISANMANTNYLEMKQDTLYVETVPRGVCSAKAFKVAALNKQAEDIYLLQNRHRIEIHFGNLSF